MKGLRKVFTGEQEENEKDLVSQVRRGPCVRVCAGTRLIHHRQIIVVLSRVLSV